MIRPALAALVALLVAAAPAAARVISAEDVLPTGQSGFVSTAGLASGTGSPHLFDQLPLFTAFRYKPYGFQEPAGGSAPRAGVRITRDAYGVPTIHGTSDANAWYGAGYAVAQDRLFQLELFRRAAEGHLAEILGKDYVDDDIIARRDYYTPAELDQQLAKLPAPLRARFAAYRDGINAWIAHVRTSPSDLPGEFAAVGALPIRDWTLEDSAAIGVLLARTVPSGDGGELDNLRRLRTVGAKNFRKLIPLVVARQRVTIPRLRFPQGPERTRKQLDQAFARSRKRVKNFPLPAAGSTGAAAKAAIAAGLPGHVGGSSMFTVRDRKHKRALLFNGPQLGFSVPELFVELEVHRPGLDVRGVTAPGVPVIGIGHNANVAWGLTSGLSDEDDLYAERANGDTYRFKGKLRAMSCRDERFDYRSPPSGLLGAAVPDAGSETVRLCRTLHGPVQARAGGVAYARRYAIWGREIETLQGLAAINEAKSVKAVGKDTLKLTWNENIMAADSGGHIGYWHPGLFQLRPKGWDERLPYPGTGEAEWRGLLDRRKDPHVIDPKQGWLANWNNVPAAGRTTGDAESPERLDGGYHRVHLLQLRVAKLAKKPSYAGAKRVIQVTGTTAQARPVATARLKAARKGSKGAARTVFNRLLAWDGSFTRVGAGNLVDPGVAIWEEFKNQAQLLALARLGDKNGTLAAQPSSSHMFDTGYAEAFALRTLSGASLRRVAAATAAALTTRFGTADTNRWGEPRRMYPLTAQGAADTPDLPFFDRGTWEEFVELGK